MGFIGSDKGRPTPQSFDLIPYPSYPYPQTSPDHLAVLGILSGLNPKEVNDCRVLELGCASGGNLLPLAYAQPKSSFVGIDFSSRAIDKARKLADALAIENVRFVELDIQKIDSSLGQFDYIIAHGIFSWVSSDVQSKLFQICRQMMAPQGIAYFSYNVFPGWHLYRIMRDMMFFRIDRETSDPSQIQEARKFLEYLAENVPNYHSLFGTILKSVHTLIADSENGYIRHDFLAEVNEPMYFTDFVAKAQANGLQFLANAELTTPIKIPEEIQVNIIGDVEDEVKQEQYLDFLRNRAYRETLLCHQERKVSRSMDPQKLGRLRIMSRVQPVEGDFDITTHEPQEFEEPDGLRLSTSHPLTKAALVHLNVVWPNSVPFQALLAEAWQMLSANHPYEIEPQAAQEDVNLLATNLLMLYTESVDLVRFFTYQPDFVLAPSDRPRASAVARHQAKSEKHVTNLYHQRVTMDRFPRFLIQYLDGLHDRSQLLERMSEGMKEGKFEITVDGTLIEDPTTIQDILAELIDGQLNQMARAALLVG